MDKIHGPGFIGLNGFLTIVPQFGFDATLRCFITQLQSQLIVNSPNFLLINLPAITLKHDVDAPIAIADAGLADLFDAGFQCGLIGATRFVMVG